MLLLTCMPSASLDNFYSCYWRLKENISCILSENGINVSGIVSAIENEVLETNQKSNSCIYVYSTRVIQFGCI